MPIFRPNEGDLVPRPNPSQFEVVSEELPPEEVVETEEEVVEEAEDEEEEGGMSDIFSVTGADVIGGEDDEDDDLSDLFDVSREDVLGSGGHKTKRTVRRPVTRRPTPSSLRGIF